MATNDKTVIPAVATHPGSVLKKELIARGIKQKDFAEAIGMPAPNLSELIKGKRNITEAIAIRLEKQLGIPFQNWMNLQNRYYYVKKCREEVDLKERNAETGLSGLSINTPELMTNHDNRKLTELVTLILNRTEGADYYKVFKILYFAEMKHLAKWGYGMVPDKFCALKYGPVPTHLYDAVKELHHPELSLSKEMANAIEFGEEDAETVLFAKRPANLKYISRSEMEALEQSIIENKSLSFGELMRKSHDFAWREAHRGLNGSNVLSPLSMAKVLGADKAILEYIEEQVHIEA